MTTGQVAARFHELAQQEKWFEIQDELFAETVRSIEPAGANLPNAAGKAAVRKKGEDLLSQVEAVTSPHECARRGRQLLRGRKGVGHDSEGSGKDANEPGHAVEVREGKIVAEQFFY